MPLIQRMRLRTLSFLSLTLLLIFSLTKIVGAQPDDSNTVRFMHIGDPQFGYGLDMKGKTSARMKTITDQINSIKPNFLVIPGDLVQDRTLSQHWAFKKSIANIDIPILMTPGNHDIENVKDLSDYREEYGPDYSVKTFGSVTIIMLNSEIMRNTDISSVEHHWQWDWLETEIDRYLANPAADKSIIFATHRPPFQYKPDEGESSSSWPPDTRKRILDLASKAGVKIFLVGHTHTTIEIPVLDHDLTIYSVGGAARVFDDMGTGFRLFEINNQQHSQQYIRTATPPKATPGWMGFKQWTPRLWDFSVRHWFWTLLFAAATLLFFRSTRKNKAIRDTRGLRRALMVSACWYLFFSINMQLDFDELITELIRGIFSDSAIKQYRHTISPIFMSALAALIGGFFMLFCRGEKFLYSMLFLMLLIPTTAWFGLQLMSHHGLGIIWPEHLWDISFLITLVIAMLSCFLIARKLSNDSLYSSESSAKPLQ